MEPSHPLASPPDIPGVEVHAAHGYLLDQCLCIILGLREAVRLSL